MTLPPNITGSSRWRRLIKRLIKRLYMSLARPTLIVSMWKGVAQCAGYDRAAGCAILGGVNSLM